MPKPRICLINMPFGAPEAPSLALTQLQSILAERFGAALEVEVHYLNLDFVGFFGGLANYRRMFTGLGHLAGLGDWFFRQVAFPEAEDNTPAYLVRYFFGEDEETRETRRLILDRRGALDAFLDRLLDHHALAEADVVGFTSLFFQTVASFAMARKLKDRRPELITAIGGAACETVMGLEYAKQVAQIDYVFSGSALVSFPRFVACLLAGDHAGCDRIDGVFSRNNPGPVGMIGEELDINANVGLDYGPFLDRFERAFPAGDLRPMLLFETSRGCSWGEKVACTFCGLNSSAMPSRAMTPECALAHLRALFEYVPRCTFFLGVDTLVPRTYFEDVFPVLGTPPNAALMYEVRSNLDEDQLRTLCQAGVYVIQPGIEAISTGSLRLMRKGATAFGNIRFLKTAARFPLRIEWNLLIGSPGEDEATCANYLADLPLLHHLHPPTGVYPISFDRYSTYFLQPERFGLQLDPQEFYRFTFPFPPEAVANVAYHFIDRRADHARIDRWLDTIGECISRWRCRWENRDGLGEARLSLTDDDPLRVVDSRFGEPRELVLSETLKHILTALETPWSRENLAAYFENQPEKRIPPAVLDRELAVLCEHKLLFQEGDRFLSLVVPGRKETGMTAGGNRRTETPRSAPPPAGAQA